jgi:hypothetical protein
MNRDLLLVCTNAIRWVCLNVVVFYFCSTAFSLGDEPQNSEGVATTEEFFETRIRPVLVDVCLQCHNDTKASGSFQVVSRDALLAGGDSGASIEAGDSNNSLLIRAIRRDHDVSAMPPEKSKALREDQVNDFKRWIDAGASWPKKVNRFTTEKHWAFEPLRTSSIPEVQNKQWIQTPVDAYILARNKKQSLVPAPPADRRSLIRRATFDLTGLPPTPQEIAAFVNDKSPDAFAKVIDRLLDSKAYGERWGRHWLDVVRYADTAGETADYPVPLAYRYRNYVIDSFNSDKPYDRFIQEQIAGDILAMDEPAERYSENVVATGFLAISRRFGFDSENYHHLTIQDTIDTLGQSVMGLTLGCARCHDHKFDAVTLKDYYALYGIFESTRYAFPGSEQKPRVRSMLPLVTPKEAQKIWRDYRFQIASLASSLKQAKQNVPSAVLKSLSDYDGDFELQAPAAGGSRGVLVPPWSYQGNIEVTTAAQSPYQYVYPTGRVGAFIPSQDQPYRVMQAIHPTRDKENAEKIYVGMDFKVGASVADSHAAHRFAIGDTTSKAAIAISLANNHLSFDNAQPASEPVEIKPDVWYSLQLELDLVERKAKGALFEPGAVKEIGIVELSEVWSGKVSQIWLESNPADKTIYSSLAIDNIAVEEHPLGTPADGNAASGSNDSLADLAKLQQELSELVGIEGDLEFQSIGKPLRSPWNGGPNSVVALSPTSQSPFTNHFPKGALGLRMPNRAEYDGFGCTFADIAASSSKKHFVGFDFRCNDVSRGGDGSWRYYIGHGPGNSAAVELFFNGSRFFRRSGSEIVAVTELAAGEWYQVQLELDFEKKVFQGKLLDASREVKFEGELSTKWDGLIDYTFIDSYGHLGGVRPGLDVDNFVSSHEALQAISQSAASDNDVEILNKQERIAQLRKAIEEVESNSSRWANELKQLIERGPIEMTYGVFEGTPINTRIQKRGEPDQLGDEVPRGFVAVLNRGNSEPVLTGSGRLELAQWLTRPDHPLTARVMVNRIWQYHFGRGLVKTPNDFGVRGSMPTHPELLDYLASEFIKSNWSIKAMHRLIMNSATYQQSSEMDPAVSQRASQSDLTDEYISFQRRRLDAEEIRDAILTISGRLDREEGAEHPFPPPSQWGFSQHGPFNAVYDHSKRSVYLMVQRIKRHPFLALFDGPDPNASTAVRLGTTVPTQALFFLNDPFVHANSEAWAERLQRETPRFDEQVASGIEESTGRVADAIDLKIAHRFRDRYEQQMKAAGIEASDKVVLAAYLRSLLGSNGFLFLD